MNSFLAIPWRLLSSLMVVTGMFFSLPGQNVQWSTYIDSVGAFSSPQAIDLNGDGIKDIVLGGGIENEPSPAGIIAMDGQNGQILWNRPTRNHLFGTPLFRDLNADSIPEVFVTGRGAQFYCLDGRDGSLIWEFWPDSLGSPAAQGWYQFYSPQWIPDQSGEGTPDLVVTNGGDGTALGTDSLRPPGRLLILNSQTGQLLAQDTLPDGHETYQSPLLYRPSPTDSLHVLFGSGGETVRGKCWRIDLNDFILTGLSQTELVLRDTSKGFIAVPSLADQTGDGIYDLVIPVHNGRLVSLDGNTLQTRWSVDFPGTENYVSPVMGQFTGDPTPDAFAIFAQGVWPFYSFYIRVLVDGANGQIVWQDTASTYQLASGNALDVDGDSFDELILIHNQDLGFYQVNFQNQFQIIDFNDQTITPFSGPRSGLNVFTSPLIDDLDQDGVLEIVYTYHPQVANWYNFEGFRVERMNLNLSTRPIAWGGYLGTQRDGVYHAPSLTGLELDEYGDRSAISVYPNPGYQELNVLAEVPVTRLQLYSLTGQLVAETQQNSRLSTAHLPAGIYFYEVDLAGRNFTGKWIHQ